MAQFWYIFAASCLLQLIGLAFHLYSPRLQGQLLNTIVNAQRDAFNQFLLFIFLFSLGDVFFNTVGGAVLDWFGLLSMRYFFVNLFKHLLFQNINMFDNIPIG